MEVQTMKAEIEEKFKSFEERLTKCEDFEKNQEIVKVVEKAVRENQPESAKDLYDEKILVEKKRLNLIYFYIPESSSEIIEERIKHDYNLLTKAYRTNFVQASDISNIFRVGKKSDSHRPLIVRFKDEVTKKKYVTESFGRKLTLKIDNEEINVSCSHDKTFKQRDEEKRLHRELTAREAQG